MRYWTSIFFHCPKADILNVRSLWTESVCFSHWALQPRTRTERENLALVFLRVLFIRVHNACYTCNMNILHTGTVKSSPCLAWCKEYSLKEYESQRKKSPKSSSKVIGHMGLRVEIEHVFPLASHCWLPHCSQKNYLWQRPFPLEACCCHNKKRMSLELYFWAQDRLSPPIFFVVGVLCLLLQVWFGRRETLSCSLEGWRWAGEHGLSGWACYPCLQGLQDEGVALLRNLLDICTFSLYHNHSDLFP